jgi:hypothetical protein
MNEFTDRYQKMASHELLEIITNAKDYQYSAVETAQKEIDNRELTERELNRAYSIIGIKLKEQQKGVKNRKEKEERLKSRFFKFIDPIHPFKSCIPSFERTIRLIIIVFGIISIYQLISDIDSFLYIIGSIGEEDLSIFIFLIPYLLLPISVYLFWKRKKIGWVLLNLYFVFSLINLVVLMVWAFQYQSSDILGIETLLFPPTSPADYILPILFYVGTIWVMCKKDMRTHFSIKLKDPFIGISDKLNGISDKFK